MLKLCLTLSLLAILGSASLASASEVARSEVAPQEIQLASENLLFRDDFENGLTRWKILDPETWALEKVGKGQPNRASTSLAITHRRSKYQPPHRSPKHVALVKDLRVGDCQVEFRVLSSEDSGPHRDCCVFFGWQDPAHFYYVHLGAKPDAASGQIMIVDGAPRRPLTNNKRPVPWKDQHWHHVKLLRNTESGHIAIYFDDMQKPLMTATDKTFGVGQVGIGSFDDRCAFVGVVVQRNSSGQSTENHRPK